MRGEAAIKRAVDIVLGSLLAILALPVIVVLAVAVAISLRANPFFVQRRVGRRGAVLHMPKLRTLPTHAPAYAPKAHIAATITTTRLCLALRRLHIDELPQLLLVPIGRLSLVGPRPELPNLHAQMDPAFAALRTSVRPGCTGLWQVGSRTLEAIPAAPGYDECYVANAGVRLDAWILCRTLPLFVGRGRPVDVADVPGWARRRSPVAAGSAASVPAVGVAAVGVAAVGGAVVGGAVVGGAVGERDAAFAE